MSMPPDSPGGEVSAGRDDLFDDANGDLAIGELEAAIGKYRQCVALDPKFFDGWHALAMALMKTGRIVEAIEAGREAVRLEPNNQLAWASLSLFFVRNGQTKEAEAAGAKAKVLSWGGRLDPATVLPELDAWPVLRSSGGSSGDAELATDD